MRSFRLAYRAVMVMVALGCVVDGARAQPSGGELEQRCWGGYVAQRTRVSSEFSSTQVGFSNLWNGQRVYSPFKVEFAVRGMGVVPAKHPLENTGHHHLLVDQRLPLNIRKGLPFSDNYLHFGGGQTSTVLNLPPGKHQLRLLFADAGHIPYFVYSPEITIEVVAKRSDVLEINQPRVTADAFEVNCARWYEDKVSRPDPVGKVAYFQNLRDGDVLGSRFNVKMGTEGYGVCSADLQLDKTGHFHLEVLRDRQSIYQWRLLRGQTQTDVDLAPGSYELKLQLRAHDGSPLGDAESIRVEVKK